MNSCLYKSQVMHRRTSPKRHAFKYGLFMFLLDLDELDEIGKGFNLIGLNRFAPFEFRDADHYDPNEIGLKNSIQQYVAENGISRPIGRIQLLTHLRTWGHLFNPVSFYFVSDNEGQPLCSIAEVGIPIRWVRHILHHRARHFLASDRERRVVGSAAAVS